MIAKLERTRSVALPNKEQTHKTPHDEQQIAHRHLMIYFVNFHSVNITVFVTLKHRTVLSLETLALVSILFSFHLCVSYVVKSPAYALAKIRKWLTI